MNNKLIKAENDLLELLEVAGDKGLDAKTCIDVLYNIDNREEEIRAAFWTLQSQGLTKFNKENRLVLK